VTTQKAATVAERGSYKTMLVTFLCVVIVAVCLTWTFLSMRAVAGVGGSCASGGPYEIATPCPDGSWLIAIALPVMIIASLAGSGFASTIGGPNLLLPMWALLFGSLGWNFFEFGIFDDDLVWSWIVCGVLFWAMALPAWWWMGAAVLRSIKGLTAEPGSKKWAAATLDGALWLWGVYVLLTLAGALLGAGSYHAIAT